MANILIILDRDGTIIHDNNYLGSDADWLQNLKIYADVAPGIRLIKILLKPSAATTFIVASNQAGVAREYYSSERVVEIHDQIHAMMKEQGVIIDNWQFCPYVSKEYFASRNLDVPNNEWVVAEEHHQYRRKPKTGMIEQAMRELGTSLEQFDKIYFLGDRLSDVQTGLNLGGTGIFIDNGYNNSEVKEYKTVFAETDHTTMVTGFKQAAKWVVADSGYQNLLKWNAGELRSELQNYGYEPAQALQSIVLVGGIGSRLKESRKTIYAQDYPQLKAYHDQVGPKGMALLQCSSSQQKKTLTDWHLDIHLFCQKISKVYLALGCRADIIKAYYDTIHNTCYRGLCLEYLEEKKPAGTIAPIVKLYQAEKLPTCPVVYANGDNLIDIDLYKCYLAGCLYGIINGISLDELIIDILALVPREKSADYGAVDYDFITGEAKEFREKRPAHCNPFKNINGREMTPINSGFSIVVNPQHLYSKYLSKDIIETSIKLENGELDYKGNESKVKYENFYDNMARKGNLVGVYLDTYWTDLGDEDKIAAAEINWGKTSIVKAQK